MVLRSAKVFLSVLVIAVLGCTSSKQEFSHTSLSSRFPTVQGERLSGEVVTLPDAYLGKAVLYLVGYEQESQFDIDRWMLALLQMKTPLTIVEIPTIESLGARLAKNFINNGMRRGIPQEDWAAVITVYEDAEKIRAFLGNSGGRNAHVALVNAQGSLQWFHNRGFSPKIAMELDEKARSLNP